MYIHYSFDIGGSDINRTSINKKRILYENELISDRNNYNVNKQIFIFLFSTTFINIE